jgi:hypothetical protein
MHLPFEDRVTMKAVEAYAADVPWDYYINLGDFLDFNCISRFNDNAPRKTEGETLFEDYNYANRFLDRHVEAVRNQNPDCQIVFLEGNHEERVERYKDQYPKLAGLFEVHKRLGLRDRGVKWVRHSSRMGKPYKIGHAKFIHGKYTNVYHAKKHALQYLSNIFYGHTHDVQEVSLSAEGDDRTYKGKSLGCLCKYSQDYMGHDPSKWQQALTVFYFYPDGYFQEMTALIFKHRFVGPTNGRVYDGRKL